MDLQNKSLNEFHQKSKFKHVRGLELVCLSQRFFKTNILEFESKLFGIPKQNLCVIPPTILKQILWNLKTHHMEFQNKS